MTVQDCVELMHNVTTPRQAIHASVTMVSFPLLGWKSFIIVTVWHAQVRCLTALTNQHRYHLPGDLCNHWGTSVSASCCEPFPDTDIDECEEENICGGNATCINTPGSYRCDCNSGYRLKPANDGFSGAEEQCEGEDKYMMCLIQQHSSDLNR